MWGLSGECWESARLFLKHLSRGICELVIQGLSTSCVQNWGLVYNANCRPFSQLIFCSVLKNNIDTDIYNFICRRLEKSLRYQKFWEGNQY